MVYDGFGLPINSMVDLSMAIAVNVISPDGKPALVQSQVFWLNIPRSSSCQKVSKDL